MKHTHNDVYAMRGIYEADAAVCSLPTAKAVGYASTAPTGLASSAAAHYTP